MKSIFVGLAFLSTGTVAAEPSLFGDDKVFEEAVSGFASAPQANNKFCTSMVCNVTECSLSFSLDKNDNDHLKHIIFSTLSMCMCIRLIRCILTANRLLNSTTLCV